MTRLHENEVPVEEALARTLVRNQFPQWTHLSIIQIVSGGTDNAVLRLGDELALRIPIVPDADVRHPAAG